MQLKEKDGILCDLCGTVYKSDFSYFSWDFKQVEVIDNRRPSLNQLLRMQTVFSLDVCTLCWDKYKSKIIKNYATTMSKVRKVPIGIVCDLSGVKLLGTFSYYYIEVTKVGVAMLGQANVCVKCHTKTFEEDSKCKKCYGTEFIRPASINTDKRFVELNISVDIYSELRSIAENMRKVAGQWATNT